MVIDNKKEVRINKRTFTYVTADSTTFRDVAKSCFTYSMPNEFSQKESSFLLLEELEMGSSGKVFLAATASGKSFGNICAIKMYVAKCNLKIDKWSSNEDTGSESDL